MQKRSVRRHSRHLHKVARWSDRPESVASMLAALGPVVYAMRTRDGLIKIGWTSDLAARRLHFSSDPRDILGFRVGTLDDEADIHARLRGLAVHGREYYPWAPEVLKCVNEMREALKVAPLAATDQAA